MFVYQNGKLYVQDGNYLTEVEIHFGKVSKIEGSTTELSPKAKVLTMFEVQSKFAYRFIPAIEQETTTDIVEPKKKAGRPKKQEEVTYNGTTGYSEITPRNE